MNLSTIPPLLAGIYRYKYLKGGLKWMFWFVVFGTFMEWSARLMVKMGYMNIPLMHLYVPVKFFIFSMAYRHFLDGFLPRRILYGITAVFIIYSAVNSFFIQSLFEYNNFVRATGSLILAVFALMWFMKTLKYMDAPVLAQEPEFWINTGALLYFSGSFFVFIMSNMILRKSVVLSSYVWWVSSGLMMLFYILIAMGFWKSKRNEVEN